MKKIVLLSFLCCAFSLTGCGGSNTHIHNPIFHDATDPTCTTDGNVEYYSCSCGKFFSDKDCLHEITEYIIPALGHDPTHYDAIPSTCITHGTIEHYECNRCHHNFADEECTIELSSIVAPLVDHQYVFYKFKKPTETSSGWIDHYECPVCKKYFIKSEGQYVETTWEEVEIKKSEFLDTPVLMKGEGYTIKFHIVDHATTYEIYDDNDYRSEPITLNASDADASGYLYYTPEVVGKHNIKVRPFAEGYYSEESEPIEAVEIKEVFAYGLLPTVHFYDIRENPQPLTYTLLMEDNTYKYVTQDEFNANYTRNRNGIMDYTLTGKIDDIMADVKELGYNIVNLSNRFTNVEEQNYWWWGTSFETSCLKRTMDAAWKKGLKCYIADFNILNYCTKADSASTITRRLADKEFQKVFTHPAFYGIELKDEPRPGDEIVNIGNSIKTILNYWRNDSYLKTLPEPHFHTDLCSFNTNDTGEGAEQRLFPTPQDYLNYLESWITNTGLSYLYFDYYTYTTYIYGQETYFGVKYYYDSSKVIFDSINSIRAKYPNLVVHQTIDASNYYNGRQTLSSTNVLASTLLSISEGMNGYSVFTFSQESSTQRSNPINLDGSRSDTFTWLKDANRQYRYLMGLLDGYSLISNEISDYKQRIKIGEDPVSGYGFDVRTSTSTFKNSNANEYKMVVNFNTYKDNTTTSVTVNQGLTYYLFGYGKSIQPLIGTGSSVTLNNGEAILIKTK